MRVPDKAATVELQQPLCNLLVPIWPYPSRSDDTSSTSSTISKQTEVAAPEATMESGSLSPLAAAVQALRVLATVPAASDSRRDFAKQELLRRIELQLQEQQLQQQEQQQYQEQQHLHRKGQWDHRHGWPTQKDHLSKQQEQQQREEQQPQREEQQQEAQEWVWQWESDATTQTEVLEQLEDSLVLLCCQQPPPALQQQLLRLLLLLVHSTEDCGAWHRVASRLLAAAGEGLHLSHCVSVPLAAAAASPPTAAAAGVADATAAGASKVLSPLPPLLLCGELFKACPQALSPLLPLLVAVGSKLLHSPAAPGAATAAATAAAVAKALRTAVAATGACGEALAGKLFSVTLDCLRCSIGGRSSSRSRSKTSNNSRGTSRLAAAEATREALLLLQQVVWAFPRGVSPPHGDALFSAALAAAAPEPVAHAATAENEDILEDAQENVPHVAAALAALLAAKAVTGMQQQQQAKQQQQLKQQQQAKQQQQQQPVSLNALDEQADLPATSGSAADFSYVSLGQCMTAAAATAAAATAASKGLYSEVRSVEDAFALLRRQWLLLHAGATTDGKKGSAGSAAAVSYIPVLQLQQQDPLLLHVDSRQQGLLRQAVAAAVPCLCRFLLRCLSPVSLVSMSLESLFTLLAQLAAAESCCSCSKRGGSSKGLQEQCVGTCSCRCSCSRSLRPAACCLSLETLHSQALVSHAAQQLLPLLQPQQQLGLVDCLGRAIAAAATGAAAPQEPTESRGSAGSSNSCGSFTHPLLLRAALNILEAAIVSVGEAGVVTFPSSLYAAFVSILTVKNPTQHVQQQQQLRCAFWPAVQRQAAACIWRARCLSRCQIAVCALRLELTEAATTAAQAALQNTNTQSRRLDAVQFAGLWGACLGLAASIANASATESQQPATAATAAAVPAAMTTAQAARSAAAAAAHTKEEGDLSNITALLGLLSRGGPEARACFFLLAEALLQQPAVASGACAAAMAAAPPPVGNEDTEQAVLLSPLFCCFLRSSRKTLSLSDPQSAINRLLHVAATTSEATGDPTATQQTPEAAAPITADTGACAATEEPADDTVTAAAATVAAKCLLLELTCAFKALAAFVRQQPEAAAAATATTRTVDADAVSDFVTLVVEASSILCCCRCNSSNNKELSLQSMIVLEEESPEKKQQEQEKPRHQQHVCCRCFCRGSAAPIAAAHAGLEAAALEALSILPHIEIHCRNQQQQQLLLQMGLSAVTIPAKAAALFPAALVACCISPAAVAPAPILRAAPLEKLQQPQILLQQLLLQQQQRGEVDSALFIGCGIAVDSLGGPTIWEAQWRCAADVTTAAFSALRLPALVAARDPAEAAVSAAETGWRADYPPHVLRVLQGGLLLRRLLFSCNICSPAAEAAVQQTAWAACCSWGRQLPPAASLDAPAVRSNRRSSKVEAGKGGAACSSTGVHLRPFGSIKGSRPQQLLQRFGLPRLKKKTICTAPAAPFAAEACFVPERDPSAFPSEDNEISVLQLGIVAAVLSDAFRAQQALLCSATRGHEQQQLSQSVVDTLWCCCEKALAAATPLERLLYADVAGGLYWFLRIADSPQQQPDAAAATGLQAVNKHIEAFLQMPLNAAETEKREVRLQMSSSRLCSVSLLAARLLPLLQRRGSSEVAAADGSSKCCQDLLQLSLAATSSIEAAEQVVAAACDTAAAAAAKDNAAAANVSSSCALLCVIRFLGATFPAVASDAAAAASSTTYATASGGETSKSLADSERPEDPQQLQQQQQNALQQQLFRAMQFLFLLRSSQFHLSRAAVLAADAARHLLECLLQHAAAAAVAGPDALLSATEEFISHAAREASYLLSVSVQRVADCSNSSSSSGIVLQVVAAAPALRCLTALMWIQSSASIAQEAPVPADGEDSTLAAAALSLRALLPAAVAVTEFAVASPSLVVRREAARSLLSMSRPLSETMWGPTIALAAAAAPPEVVTAATAPVAGDPQLAIFLLEALNSECDALQRQLLLQVLQQQVRIWGPRNLMQWVSLLTSLCCGCVPASSPLAQQLCTLRPSSYSNRYGSSAPFLLQRAQQLLPQSPKVLLSPLAAARPLPALTGLVWNPLPGVSAPAVARTQHESCRADTKGSTNDDCNESEVQPVVRSAAAECLELLLTLPELQQQHHSWVAPAADVYQTKQAGSEAATPAGSFLIDCLPLLVRAACELLWQGIRQQQQKQQQQSGLASDGGISLSPRGLRILLLLLERLTGDSSEPRDGSQELPVQQLQQYEVGVSSAVSGLLRCCAKASAPELLELPETAGAVAAAIATAFVAAEGEMAMALRRAAFLRLRAAAAGGDAINDEENHQQQLLQTQEPQQQQLTDMALEVMLRFAEAGCCLSPWRLVGQLLLPLGDVVQSAAALVAEAIAATPEVSQSDWLLHRRLLLACRLVAHVVAAAAPTTGAPPSTPTAAVNVFVEQREQWVAAIEPCAVPLALHLMGRLLKLSRQREQQELQQCQKQQQQEEHQLLKGLALLCRPLSTESGDRQAAAASAFAALAAASRSNSTGGTAAAGEAAAATATGAALLEAFCHLLNGLSDALLRPVETAAAACESCPADADWSETAVDGVCWRLELIGILLPSLCFPLNPQQQQRKQLPQQQQQHQLDEEDWTEDWLGADSPTSSSGAQAPVVAPADASAPVVPAEGSADVGCLYHVVLRRTCEAAGRLAGAAAEVAAAEAAAAAKLEVHDYSGEAPATASLPQQGMTPFDGVEEAQAAADASASTVDFASVPLTGGAAGRVVYCCINFLWGVSATLQQNPEVLGEEASAFAFFGAIRDVSGAALWLPVDAARPAAKAAEDDRPSGPLCEAALSLLQRGFSVVAMMPPGTAAASAFTLLLSPLEVPVFPSRLCYGTANCVSPLEAMRLLRSLYQAAARAAGAAAAAPAAVTTTEDAAAAARLASTGLQGHFAGLIESAVSAFTGTAADLEKELPKAATAAAPAVSPAASGDTGGVLALAAALVAIDALSVTKGPSSSIGVNEQLQQQQQPEWCVRIKAALQRLSEFAYAVDASGDRVALAASAEKRMDSEAATGSLDSSATAKERPPTAAGIKRNVSGNSAANGNGAGAADATVVLEKGTTSDTAITAAQGETGTEAAGGFPLLWPTHRQHAAAQLRGFLLRVARVCSQRAAAAPDSFPCLLAAAAVSCLIPSLSPHSFPKGGNSSSCSYVCRRQLSAVEALQSHPLRTLESFLMELSPQDKIVPNDSDLSPLSEALVAALGAVIAGVFTLQAEAEAAANVEASGPTAAAAQGGASATGTTATHSVAAQSESSAGAAEAGEEAAAHSEEAATEAAAATPDSSALAPHSLADTGKTAPPESRAALPQSVPLDRTVAARESAPTAASDSAATEPAARAAASDSAPPESAGPDPAAPEPAAFGSAQQTAEAAATPESSAAAEPAAEAAETPGSTPAGTVGTFELSETRRAAYRAAAASLVYLAVSKHPTISARAIEWAAAAAQTEEETEVTEASASASRTQQVKAAVARLLQEEVERKQDQGA